MTQSWAIDQLDALPLRVSDGLLQQIVGLGHSAYAKHKRRGAFRFLELHPAVPGSKAPYSGYLVQKWLRGELKEAGAARRFFSKAS
jgi:hypothetical protein